jgi:hypothetical protein
LPTLVSFSFLTYLWISLTRLYIGLSLNPVTAYS